MDVLFVHGAGGWVDDQPLIEQLRSRHRVEAPHIPDDDMSAAAWRREVVQARGALGDDVVVVGHSFGASIAMLEAADPDSDLRPSTLVLLAMPFWGPEGWDVEEYALPAGARPSADLPIELHHCRDDEAVSIDHVDLHLRALPRARAHRHDTGGHQLVGVDWWGGDWVSRVV